MRKIILLSLLLGIVLISGCIEQTTECQTDEDCVPATCCHADSCVLKNQAPDCEGVACTLDCQGGTMDCGQGSCVCVNSKCQVEWHDVD